MGVEKIEQITSILGVDASKITLISIWIFCFFLAMKLLGSGPTNDKGREDLAKIAGKLSSQLRTFYNGSVATMLLFIDKWARDRFVAKTIRSLPKGLRPFKAPSPWSVGLYDMTLKLALAYPIVFLIFGWLLSGNILVDLRMFLPQIPEITHRGLIIFGLVISVFFIYRFKRSTGGHAMLYLVLVGVGFIPLANVNVLAAAVAVAIFFVASLEGPDTRYGRFPFIGANALGGIIVIAIGVAIASAFGSTNSILGVATMVAVFTLVGIGGYFGKNLIFLALWIVATPLAYHYPSENRQLVAGSIVSEGGMPDLTRDTVNWPLRRRRILRRILWILHVLNWLTLVGFAVAVLRFFPAPGSNLQIIAGNLILFLALLPLANAPIDWLSLGLTRWLLADGLAMGGMWRVAFISIIDIAFAALMMVPLTVITVCAISVANWAAISGGGEALLPLAGLFDAVRIGSGEPKFYWIYLMLFSSLLPSLVHILSGLVGLVLACLQTVFKSAELAQSFVTYEIGEDVSKQTKLVYWYPALAATGATSLAAIVYLAVSAVPFATSSIIVFAKVLLTTAEWTASFFPA